MLNRLQTWFRTDLAVDLGTSRTLVASSADGVIIDEPSVVAIDRGSGEILGRGAAVGTLARQMLGRTPDSMRAVRPLKSGVVTDFRLAEAMLGYFLQKALRGKRFRTRLVVTVPSGLTPVEHRAVLTSAERAGANQVYLLEEAVAAAVGAGLPISEPLASLVVSIGGGTTEIAVLSLGEIIAGRSLRIAGDEFDEAIVEYFRLHYSMRIGNNAAEQLKRNIGSAMPLPGELSAEIAGLDSVSGIPRKATITSEEIREALREPLLKIVAAIRSVIERCDPELVGDLSDTGLLLTGGSAQLRGLSDLLQQQLGIPVRCDHDVSTTVIRGAQICLDHLEAWRPRFLTHRV
jgi:rod shape-determining protein MreB